MSFQNVYYKRATATSRACYVCSKPTTTCLATANAVDFLYTCETYLSDAGFATEIVDPNAQTKEVVSQEEIARVKAEWEAKEARKKAKGAGAAKEAGGSGGPPNSTGGEGDKKEEEGKDNDTAKSPSPSFPGALSSSSAASSAPATPTHKRYSLHRDFYAMRQAEHRRRRKAKQTQELAPRLPGAPRGLLPG